MLATDRFANGRERLVQRLAGDQRNLKEDNAATASIAAASRDSTPSFANRFLTCVVAVAGRMPRIDASSQSRFPSAIQKSTSASRLVRLAKAASRQAGERLVDCSFVRFPRC